MDRGRGRFECGGVARTTLVAVVDASAARTGRWVRIFSRPDRIGYLILVPGGAAVAKRRP